MTQRFPDAIEFVIFSNNALPRAELFPYKHSISYILARLDVTRQEEFLQDNVEIVNFFWMPCLGTPKHWKNAKIINFMKLYRVVTIRRDQSISAMLWLSGNDFNP